MCVFHSISAFLRKLNFFLDLSLKFFLVENLVIISFSFAAFDNNPGWFIIEDESVNVGNMGLLRRNLPLLANKVPLIMVESKHTVSFFELSLLSRWTRLWFAPVDSK